MSFLSHSVQSIFDLSESLVFQILTPTALGMMRHPELPGVRQLGRIDIYYVTVSMKSRVRTTQGPLLKPHRSVIKVTSQRMGSHLRPTWLTRQLKEFFFYFFSPLDKRACYKLSLARHVQSAFQDSCDNTFVDHNNIPQCQQHVTSTQYDFNLVWFFLNSLG